MSLNRIIEYTAVTPSYYALFGSKPKMDRLIKYLKRYSVNEWLSYTSRFCTTFAVKGVNDDTAQRECLSAVTTKSFAKSLDKWAASLNPQPKYIAIFNERQLGIVQQLAMLYSPENGASFNSNTTYKDFTRVCMIVNNFLEEKTDLNDIKASYVQSMIFSNLYSVSFWTYLVRAQKFYQLDKEYKDPKIREYLSLFESETGIDASDFIAGGMCVSLTELNKSLEDHIRGWFHIASPQDDKSIIIARCLNSFIGFRSATIEELRSDIGKMDAKFPIESYSLLPLLKKPLVKLSNGLPYVLSATGVGRALFDGIYHANLSSALKEKDKVKKEQSVRRINGLYGDIFEIYIKAVLEEIFGNKFFKINQDDFPGFVDFIVIGKSELLLIEVKSSRFLAREHYRALTLLERKVELNETGLPHALKQLNKTILAIREAKQINKDVDGNQIKEFKIIPITVTEEFFPSHDFLWEEIYSESDHSLNYNGKKDNIGYLRMMCVNDLERLEIPSDPNSLIASIEKWSFEKGCRTLTFKNFTIEEKIRTDFDFENRHREQTREYFLKYVGADGYRD